MLREMKNKTQNPKTCVFCGCLFRSKNPKALLCSADCSVKYRSVKAMIDYRCSGCGKTFRSRAKEKRKYCDIDCMLNYKKGKARPDSVKRKISDSHKTSSKAKAARIKAVQRSAELRRGKARPIHAVEATTEKLRGRPQISQNTKKGPTNIKSRRFHLRSPDNKTFSGTNLLHFVRENENLFLADDVIWVPVTTGKGALTCRAYKGLCSLFRNSRPPGSWKGWTIVSLTEAFHNNGDDVLSRPNAQDDSRDLSR
jgi:hypothetical protein